MLSQLFFALLQALLLFALAPLLSGLSRVCRARIHTRRGPGPLQEYRDLFKLLARQSVSPQAAGSVFRLMPYAFTGVMLTLAAVLPVVTPASPLPALADVISVIYLFAVARFVQVIAGLDSGSPFTGISASREATLGVLTEPILLLALWVAALIAGAPHLDAITARYMHWDQGQTLTQVLALLAAMFASFIEMGKLPFDVAEAEQELQEGVLTEYSGAGLAILKWGISLKQLVVLQLFIGVFLPFGQQAPLALAGLIALAKLLLAIGLIALLENTVARLRFVAVARITWTGFGLACLALVSLLVS